MRTKINQLLAVLILLIVNGCSAGVIQTEPISSQNASNPTSTEPLLITTSPNLGTTKTPEPDIEKKYTYFLDQEAIGQFCLEFPMLTIYQAKDIGSQFYAGVLEQNNISVISPEDGALSPVFTPEFPQGQQSLARAKASSH